MITSNADVVPSSLQLLARQLLDRAGLSSEFCLVPLKGGRNNRVFRLESAHGQFLFKQYFYSKEDPRDRLKPEILFLEYLAAFGCAYTAQPYACDPENRVALMEFIQGTPLTILEINDSSIDQAINFFLTLNSRKFTDAGRALPVASEACFSLSEHLSIVQRRINRLENISGRLPIDQQAREFVRGALKPLWQRICHTIQRTSFINEVLPLNKRCLSPSDFGFHNALRQANGSLKFVDFEYAGWDDPAKLIIDFANQPDMTLDRKHSNRFRCAIIESDPEPEHLLSRVTILEPLYQIKWVCICLNDFLLLGTFRRDFTGEEEGARKTLQLDRAKKMLGRAEETFAI